MQDSVTVKEQGSRPAPRDPDGSRGLPLVVYVLAMGTFLMLTTEFVVAGILPDVAGDIGVSLARSGLLITVFAIGMVVGAPLMAMLTLRMSQQLTLMFSLAVFAAGHVAVAVTSNFGVLLAARFVTALATGAFWAVAAVVATRVASPGTRSRAVGVVNAGGMLATVLGVPLGTLAAQLFGWRGTFWALAVLAIAAVPVVARHVPLQPTPVQEVSIRSELTALASGRLWWVLAACATTTGGVLAAYSFITSLLDEAGVPAASVPLVLAGFGIGSLVGSLVGGRLGDSRPYVAIVVAPAMTTLILITLSVVSSVPGWTAVLAVLLGFFGLGANPVLISMAVRYAAHAPTLGSALSVAAFNFGTAIATWLGALALDSRMGAQGPVATGAAISVMTLIPTIALARVARSGRRLPRMSP